MACPSAELLEAYREMRFLPPEVFESVRVHVLECAACRAVSTTSQGGTIDTQPDKVGAVSRAIPQPGEAVGRYIVIGRLGEGGMGAVCLAYDPKLDRKVALKFLRRGMANWEQRLIREAQAMAHLPHQNIVPVHDVGEHNGLLFIAMEFVDGATVANWLKERPRSVREIVDVYIAAGRGIAAAHAAGLIHRDIKPANLLVGKDGRVLVTDFGLVRASGPRATSGGGTPPPEAGAGGDAVTAVGASGEVDSASSLRFVSSSSSNDPLTHAGTILGTPAYMAPEQYKEGATVDERTDQFSFCVALYRALYGEPPFEARIDGVGKLREPPDGKKVPRHLRRAILRGLSLDPAARHPSMTALLAALAHDPAVARRRVLAAAGALLAIAAAVAAWRFDRAQRSRVCAGADEQLAEAWSAQRKEPLAAVFRNTGLPWAPRALEQTLALLDGYGRRWSTMWRDACEATRVRGDQSEELLDLRVACLDDRRAELRSLVDQLTSGDRAVLEHAVSAAQSLAPVDECADARLLKEPMRPPSDPSRRRAIEGLRARLAQARGLFDAGRYAAALAAVEAVTTEARASAFRPLDAEAAYQRGLLLERTGDEKGARAALLDALVAAEEGRHDLVAGQAAVELVRVLANGEPHFDDALVWSRHAEAWIRRDNGNDRLLSSLDYNLGVLYFRMGKYDQALTIEERAVALRERLYGPDHTEVAAVLGELANIYEAQGQRDRAVEIQRRVLATTEKQLGPDHPDVGAGLVNLAAALGNQGKFADALALYQRALAIFERAYPPDHPFTATCLANLGEAQAGLGKLDDALLTEKRALAMRQRLYGTTHPDVAVSLSAIG
ncbi:MAG: tetratricopeptide repeat protein, partial [Polyangia bacterium]